MADWSDYIGTMQSVNQPWQKRKLKISRNSQAAGRRPALTYNIAPKPCTYIFSKPWRPELDVQSGWTRRCGLCACFPSQQLSPWLHRILPNPDKIFGYSGFNPETQGPVMTHPLQHTYAEQPTVPYTYRFSHSHTSDPNLT